MPVVVISPFNVASFPEGGGHFWVYLQYVLGLRRLGCDVYWLEAFRANASRKRDALTTFRARMEEHGLGGKFILYTPPGDDRACDAPADYINMSRADAEAIFADAELLLNFHYAISAGLLARFRRTALVDIDPGLLQFWMTRGQLHVARHDLYFTIGETIGGSSLGLPDCSARWKYLRPPISLQDWPYTFDPRSDAFTTVSIWDSSDWIVDNGLIYENTKRVAFLEFADLPRLTSQPLELALFLRTDRDMEDRASLERRGWRVRLSGEVAATPHTYREYIQRSRGEFSCAKRSYRELRSAWVSDRTLCYLASGKPVVVQHTGPSAFLPNGEGMFRFRTPKEAADAFGTINADYEGHCQAARAIAEKYFDAGRVLENLLSVARG